MAHFPGFSDQETFTRIPDTFLRHLLSEIEDADELKVSLYFFWRIEHMEGRYRSLSESEILADATFMQNFTQVQLAAGLEKAVQRGSLLKVETDSGSFYFLNSPRGRAAVEAMKKNGWRAASRPVAPLPIDRPNIFKLYEENIGPLTPMIADALKEAEQEYPPEWIEQAVGEAAGRNKRSWKYVETILRRWKEEGHGEEQDRRDAEKDRRKYVEGKYAPYVKH
jgi:DnaD/phage-associated family protein